MKKLSFTLVILLFISQLSHAQWAADPSNPNNISNTNTGNVGVGTSTLSAKFTIYQGLSLGPAIKNNILLSSTTGNATANVFKNNLWIVRNTAGIDWLTARLHDGISIDNSFLTPQTDTRTWWERDPYNNIQSWGNSANTYLTINKGNVGIGTTAPISTFQIGAGIYKFSVGNAPGVDLRYGTSYVGFNAARNSGNWTVDGDGYHNGGGVFYADVLGAVYIVPIASVGPDTQTLADIDIKNKIAFRISPEGVTYAKQINVQLTGWPDYVFKKDYQLPSLTDVKNYIDQNQHLPDMPSEVEIAKDGLNLGEMNKLLVKKVEELTLYLIESNKKQAEQEERLKKLELQLGERNQTTK